MRGDELLPGLKLQSQATDAALPAALRRQLVDAVRIIIPVRPSSSLKNKFVSLGNPKSG
ncbi:MAG TPA: hypothetical protein GX511_00555 [Firmicutes bacterium]|nr:hypothetical protein [Bacillota bacterium]